MQETTGRRNDGLGPGKTAVGVQPTAHGHADSGSFSPSDTAKGECVWCRDALLHIVTSRPATVANHIAQILGELGSKRDPNRRESSPYKLDADYAVHALGFVIREVNWGQ